jgi:hypothetical protein
VQGAVTILSSYRHWAMKPGLGLLALWCCGTAASAQTAPPRVSRIEIGRDTVRFVATEDYELRARFAYARASGTWSRIDRTPGPWPNRRPSLPNTRVAVGHGWHLAAREYGLPNGGSETRDVLVTPAGTPIDVRPSVDSTTLREIIQSTGESEVSLVRGLSGFSKRVADWRREGDTLWMAWGSNWGALLKFNTRTRRMETFATGWVADAIITGFATTRRAAWMALNHHSGFDGLALARFDRTTHEWRRLTPATATLPDSEIVAMDGAGDTLWIATREALAMYDDVSGTWDVRWFRVTPTIVEQTEERFGTTYTDSVIRPRWELSPTRDDASEHANRVIIDVSRAIEPESPMDEVPFAPDSFLAVARSIPPEHFAAAWRWHWSHDNGPESDVGRALAHPRLIRFVVHDTTTWDALGETHDLRAFGLLGDSRWLPYVQWASRVRPVEPVFDATAAWARARLGDTSWIPQLRDAAVTGGWEWDRNWMADLLVDVGDTAIYDRVYQRIRRERVVWPYGWLARHLPRERWLAIVREAAESPTLRASMLLYLYMYAHDDVSADSAIQSHVRHIVQSVLGELSSDSAYSSETRHELMYAVTSFVLRLRDAATIPGLIAVVAKDSALSVRATTALIHLSGVDSLPGSPRSDAAERAVIQRFWEQWWSLNRTKPLPSAEPQRADAVAARWWRKGVVARP